MSATVPPDMQRAALEWQAEEHAQAARLEAKVEALQASTAPADAPPSPEAAQAAQAAAVAQSALPQVAAIAWRMADRGIQGFLGPHVAATPDELQQLAALTVPVIEKWLPKDMTGFFATPEGALAFAVVAVYGLKAAAGAPTPTPAAPETPAAAPSPEVAA